MRPSQFNPAPSILLRPAFTVTGPMLETTIHRMLVSVINDAPAPKITESTIVGTIHELLRDGGLNFFRDHALGNPHVMPEQQELAAAHARILFPEFFEAVSPDELKALKKLVRDASKPAATEEQQAAAGRNVGDYAPGSEPALPGSAPAAGEELAWDDPRQTRTIPDGSPAEAGVKAARKGRAKGPKNSGE